MKAGLKSAPSAALVLAALLTAWPARAQLPQTSPDEQARRLLEDGRSYWRQGKLKQALDNFNTIASGFQNTDSVDDALLEIGRYYMEVENNPEKARESFDRVAKTFPQSDGAPGAYYNLGLLALSRATTQAELDDAQAQFTRVQRLYPRSEWVPRAMHAEGLALRRGGKLADAVEVQRRVSLEYPSSDAAPAAQFQIGHCLALMGEYRQAMEDYQQVRNRFPDSEWAARALDRITALYRLHGGPKPAYALDPGFSVGTGDVLKDVRALLVTPDRTLWIASEKVNSVVPFDPSGKMGPSLGGQDVRSLSLSPRAELLVTSRLAVRFSAKDVRSFAIPSDKPGIPEPLEKLSAAVATPGGALLVADEKKKRVYRFDALYQYQGVFADGRDREAARLLLDGEGAIVLLDRDDRTVGFFDENGRVLRSLAPKGAGYELRRPVDVAVDPARHVYVADEQGGVYVFTPQGQLLLALGGEELKKPKALALDPSGAVLVYDETARRVLRYR